MTAPVYDLTIEQGATSEIPLQWKDAAKCPYDLTGASALLQVRSNPSAPDVLLELSTENGRIDLSKGNGQIVLLFSEVVTRALAFDAAVYDLLVRFPTGVIRRVIEGRFIVSPGVTKWPTP